MIECTKRKSDCPICFGLDTFGDKWTLLIIRDLVMCDKRYYGEFLDSDEKIATNILANRLKKLEAHGIFRKTIDTHNKRKNRYDLTEKGIDLIPILVEIGHWGGVYDESFDHKDSEFDKFSRNKELFIKELREKMKK